MSSIPLSPTVGRSVHVYRHDDGVRHGPFAATVTAVHDHERVTVFCMEPNRASHLDRLRLYGEHEELPEVRPASDQPSVYCVWPPRYESLASGVDDPGHEDGQQQHEAIGAQAE